MADSTIVILIFENEQAAERLFDTLQETLKVESLPVDNAAVSIFKQNGEVTVKQMIHPIGENGFDLHLWEFLIRTMLSGWGHHIDDWFIEQFKQGFQPGTSAFFTLVEPYASKEIIFKLRQFSATLIYVELTEEKKAMLKAASSAMDGI